MYKRQIIAHFSNTKGIVIHTERCKNIRSIRKDPALCAQVNWDEKVEGDFAVEIKVLSEDKPGLLAEISTVISNYQANIESFKTDAPIGNSIQMHIVMNVTDRDHLARIMRKLRRLSPVLSVFRLQNKDSQE